tara:strand:- start:344 stop:949 length:606 start_codon:yes stop_codon:yes gene_type:complete
MDEKRQSNQKTTTVMQVDLTTYNQLKAASNMSNRSKKKLAEDIAVALSCLLDVSTNTTNHLDEIRKALGEASINIPRDDGSRLKAISVSRNHMNTLRKIKTLYDLSYSQLIQAGLAYINNGRVIQRDELTQIRTLVKECYDGLSEDQFEIAMLIHRQFEYTAMLNVLDRITATNQFDAEVVTQLYGTLETLYTAPQQFDFT